MAAGEARRRQPNDQTEVSCVIKYLLFSANVIFWLVGIGILGVGIWAWTEKDMFQQIGRLAQPNNDSQIFADPGLIFIIVGAVMFIIGFAGCIGALRENTCLLMFFMACLIVILLVQVTGAVLLFVYKDWVEKQAAEALSSYISKYRDDPDLQNVIDWIQDTWLECCGILGPDDWDSNIYFNCSSLSREACGVPFSCCRRLDDEAIINLQCGYDVRREENAPTLRDKINTVGGLDAAKTWVDSNMIAVAGAAVGIAVIEILGICFAHNLRQDIFAQKAKWRRR